MVYHISKNIFFQKVKFKRKKEKKTCNKNQLYGSIRRVDLLIFVYRLIHYKQMDLYAISEDPNKVPAFCGISFRSAMFAFLKVKIISRF